MSDKITVVLPRVKDYGPKEGHSETGKQSPDKQRRGSIARGFARTKPSKNLKKEESTVIEVEDPMSVNMGAVGVQGAAVTLPVIDTEGLNDGSDMNNISTPAGMYLPQLWGRAKNRKFEHVKLEVAGQDLQLPTPKKITVPKKEPPPVVVVAPQKHGGVHFYEPSLQPCYEDEESLNPAGALRKILHCHSLGIPIEIQRTDYARSSARFARPLFHCRHCLEYWNDFGKLPENCKEPKNLVRGPRIDLSKGDAKFIKQMWQRHLAGHLGEASEGDAATDGTTSDGRSEAQYSENFEDDDEDDDEEYTNASTLSEVETQMMKMTIKVKKKKKKKKQHDQHGSQVPSEYSMSNFEEDSEMDVSYASDFTEGSTARSEEERKKKRRHGKHRHRQKRRDSHGALRKSSTTISKGGRKSSVSSNISLGSRTSSHLWEGSGTAGGSEKRRSGRKQHKTGNTYDGEHSAERRGHGKSGHRGGSRRGEERHEGGGHGKGRKKKGATSEEYVYYEGEDYWDSDDDDDDDDDDVFFLPGNEGGSSYEAMIEGLLHNYEAGVQDKLRAQLARRRATRLGQAPPDGSTYTDDLDDLTQFLDPTDLAFVESEVKKQQEKKRQEHLREKARSPAQRAAAQARESNAQKHTQRTSAVRRDVTMATGTGSQGQASTTGSSGSPIASSVASMDSYDKHARRRSRLQSIDMGGFEKPQEGGASARTQRRGSTKPVIRNTLVKNKTGKPDTAQGMLKRTVFKTPGGSTSGTTASRTATRVPSSNYDVRMQASELGPTQTAPSQHGPTRTESSASSQTYSRTAMPSSFKMSDRQMNKKTAVAGDNRRRISKAYNSRAIESDADKPKTTNKDEQLASTRKRGTLQSSATKVTSSNKLQMKQGTGNRRRPQTGQGAGDDDLPSTPSKVSHQSNCQPTFPVPQSKSKPIAEIKPVTSKGRAVVNSSSSSSSPESSDTSDSDGGLDSISQVLHQKNLILPDPNGISIMSFTPAFTFSMFTLPPGYKNQNQNIKRKQKELNRGRKQLLQSERSHEKVRRKGRKKSVAKERTKERKSKKKQRRASEVEKLSSSIQRRLMNPKPIHQYMKKLQPIKEKKVKQKTSVAMATASFSRASSKQLIKDGSGDPGSHVTRDMEDEVTIATDDTTTEMDEKIEEEIEEEIEEDLVEEVDVNNNVSRQDMESDMRYTGLANVPGAESVILHVRDYR